MTSPEYDRAAPHGPDATAIFPDRYYTPVQVGHLLDLSPQTLAGWRVQRRGPAYVKLTPKVVRYRGSELLEFLKAAAIGAESPKLPAERVRT